jgi:hypothetical protein
VLSACEKPTSNVNIHGVNYSSDTFSYHVSDPAKPDSSGGGELIDPFGAGGTTCCVTLPNKWRTGIKVLVHTTHWLPQRPDGSLPEVKEEHLVEVPPYVDGKPGELWVLRAADGTVSVISSDFQPDHPKWPGKVKGWPVPSLEYQRERWELQRKHEAEGVELYLSFLDELKKDPLRRAKDAWDFRQKDDPGSLRGYAGPQDPRYQLMLKQEYEEGLERSRRLLQQVMETRP